MPIYKCKICKLYKTKAKAPPSACPECHHNLWEEIECSRLLILQGKAEKLVVFDDIKEFKRDSFRVFGDLCGHVSRDGQFTISFDPEEDWEIEGTAGVKNPTLLNRADVGGKKEKLKDGDIISVGPLALTVAIEKDGG
jgi:hypothetical protein